jgi:hypothetical protein
MTILQQERPPVVSGETKHDVSRDAWEGGQTDENLIF